MMLWRFGSYFLLCRVGIIMAKNKSRTRCWLLLLFCAIVRRRSPGQFSFDVPGACLCLTGKMFWPGGALNAQVGKL